ncbi:heavy-metal-associated domain-containing protein [Kribbella pittospori]|nr:heavy-metal-associated domain-containing protein [Kribbella pittospori]
MIDEPALAGRSAVARLLTELAYDVLDEPVPVLSAPYRLTCTLESVAFSTDQAEFVRSRLWPCPPKLVTSASHRVTWVDSEGVTNVAHSGSLGPTVPIVAREATLVLWARLRADSRLAERADAVDPVQADLLAQVTTDKVPAEILRTGVDAAARVLTQHAYLAGTTPYDEPAGFAEALRDSGIFNTVAGTWHWGLQASTYRRGLIPVQLVCFGGRMTYSADSVAALREMKETRIEAARASDDSDPSAAQYVVLGSGEQPRCLAHAPHSVDGRRVSLVTQVANSFVDAFTRLLKVVTVDVEDAEETSSADGQGEVFEVPDMTCQHCIRTITEAVGEFGVAPPEFDLETKRVVARFGSAEVREQSFAAIRARGYTVVPLAR